MGPGFRVRGFEFLGHRTFDALSAPTDGRISLGRVLGGGGGGSMFGILQKVWNPIQPQSPPRVPHVVRAWGVELLVGIIPGVFQLSPRPGEWV